MTIVFNHYTYHFVAVSLCSTMYVHVRVTVPVRKFTLKWDASASHGDMRTHKDGTAD
jgi:hypothetical protein